MHLSSWEHIKQLTPNSPPPPPQKKTIPSVTKDLMPATYWPSAEHPPSTINRCSPLIFWGKGETGTQDFRTAWDVSGQKFQWHGLKWDSSMPTLCDLDCCKCQKMMRVTRWSDRTLIRIPKVCCQKTRICCLKSRPLKSHRSWQFVPNCGSC